MREGFASDPSFFFASHRCLWSSSGFDDGRWTVVLRFFSHARTRCSRAKMENDFHFSCRHPIRAPKTQKRRNTRRTVVNFFYGLENKKFDTPLFFITLSMRSLVTRLCKCYQQGIRNTKTRIIESQSRFRITDKLLQKNIVTEA